MDFSFSKEVITKRKTLSIVLSLVILSATAVGCGQNGVLTFEGHELFEKDEWNLLCVYYDTLDTMVMGLQSGKVDTIEVPSSNKKITDAYSYRFEEDPNYIDVAM